MRQLKVENTRGSKLESNLIRLFGRTVASGLLYFLELVEVVVISFAIILPIRYFLIQPFYVKGMSMSPTFEDREYLVIDELSYRFRQPERGEVVVFRYPADPRQFFIKRLIGLPNETVTIENGVVMITSADQSKSFVLDEPYLHGINTDHSGVTKLGVDQYYILGDNRGSSLDSRYFGAIDKELIVGRVWIRGWPIDRASIIEAPAYTN